MAETKKASAGAGASTGEVVGRGVRLLAEAGVAPGASRFLDGEIRSGFAHLGLGILGRALLGPVGVALVAANSYSRSVTGKGLTGHLRGERS